MRTRISPNCSVRHSALPVSPGCSVAGTVDQSVAVNGMSVMRIARVPARLSRRHDRADTVRGAMTDWNPGLYLKFDDQRTRPARDLLARVPHPAPKRVVDLGCGPGNSTELLHEHWPEARILGIDNSPGMLDQARRAHPDWLWEEH